MPINAEDEFSRVPLPPDETLFKQKNAPIRYEEDDIYFADRHLESHQRLPDSDSLKAIHAYTSDFYAASLGTQAKRDWKSMDETALLALGILLEEAAADVLGKTGDLAFMEDEDDDQLNMPQAWDGVRWTRSVIRRDTVRRSHRQREPRPDSRDSNPIASAAVQDRSQDEEELASERNGKQDWSDPE